MPFRRTPRAAAGFTLIELLVVIGIILIVSAATLPVVLPALNHRQIGDAARLLHGTLAGARDAAIRAHEPRGIRLLPDAVFNGVAPGSPLAVSRMIAIEPAPGYTEGMAFIPSQPATVGPFVPFTNDPRMIIREVKWANPPANTIPNPPTSWYWNIRQGEKIRIEGTGRSYTIVGPMVVPVKDKNGNILNPDRFINIGLPGVTLPGPMAAPEFLIVVNGQDDNGNGYIDDSFDGIDNDRDSRNLVDPGFNGLDDDLDGVGDNLAELFLDNEFEPEQFVGTGLASFPTGALKYRIDRRPAPAPGAREVALPQDVVIDLTTANSGAPERSRLPVDPATGQVDILVAPNGQVIPSSHTGNASGLTTLPYYHFWLAERQDVTGPGGTAGAPQLPMAPGTPGYSGPALKGERRLVTLFPRTGLLTTNPILNFDATSWPAAIDLPYLEAQSGKKATK
jgi:prepilin-type N-terminal cleavage/methylation domain-containing protein